MIDLHMSSFTYGPIIPRPGVPDSLLAAVIPDSDACSAEGAYGKILFQRIDAGEITILYNVYQIEKDIAIDFRCSPGTLQTHVALKNDSQYFISGIGELYLAEGQFNIIDTTRLEGSFFLEGGQEYRTLHIVFSSQFLDRLLPVFPDLEEWLASDSPQPRLLFKIHAWLSEQLKNVINSFLHCPYTMNGQSQFYREIKAMEFFCLGLSSGSGEITPAVKLTRRNIEVIHTAKQIMDTNFDQHITIASIVRQTGMNEFKLKAGFKQIFGISIFEYLIKTRMQTARNLLLETDKPIKEIAILTGYATKQSFLNAFKRYFHDTPGAFRKN